MKNNEPAGISGNLPWEEAGSPHQSPFPGNEDPTRPLASPGMWLANNPNGQVGGQEYWQPPTMPPVLTAPPRSQKPKGVSRRAILVGAGGGALGIGAIGAGLGYILSKHTASGPANLSTSDASQIAHLMRHAGFGLWPVDIANYIDAGVSGAIDLLLNYSSISNSEIDSLISGLNLDFTLPQDIIRWFTLRMLYSKHPLEEKMTMFWHGVLVSGLDKGGKRMPPFLAEQNQTLRENCLGRFDDLIHAISVDPAMLVYLDGALSTGDLPNENYSRELMELFTLGIVTPQGAPNYTQTDVHQGALALTGWTIRNNQGVFVPRRHYDSSITYLGHTGNLGLDDVVRIVSSHPSTPYHIAWRMWCFFAYSTTPNDTVLQPLVNAYNNNNHSIRAMVEAMLRSPAFFGDKAYRQRLKSPVEFLAGAIRGLGIQTTLATNALRGLYVELGQTPFDPPNVSGWDGDKNSQAWLTTETWMSHVNLINTLVLAATGSAATASQRQTIQSTPSTSNSPVQQVINQRDIANSKDLTDYYIAAMLDNNLGNDRRAALYDAINQSGQGPTLTLSGGAKVPAVSVRQMLYLLMTMPEYQLN